MIGSLIVFPAPAGVILDSSFLLTVSSGFPRTCGGEPKLYIIGNVTHTFSPHLRG